MSYKYTSNPHLMPTIKPRILVVKSPHDRTLFYGGNKRNHMTIKQIPGLSKPWGTKF